MITVAGIFAFAACGPNQADLDKKAKAKHDSDSMATANEAASEMAKMKEQNTADSIKQAEAAKMMADSLHADSVKRRLIKGKK